jgi:hypothetical protein
MAETEVSDDALIRAVYENVARGDVPMNDVLRMQVPAQRTGNASK